MRARVASLLAAIGVLAAATAGEAQSSRRTTMTVSVRVVRAPAPAVSSAGAMSPPGSGVDQVSAGQPSVGAPSPGQPAPQTRTDVIDAPAPVAGPVEGGDSTSLPAGAEVPSVRLVTINF